jgi:hypothetical protein
MQYIYPISVLFEQTAASKVDVTALCVYIHMYVAVEDLPEMIPVIKISRGNLVLYIYRAVVLRTQVSLQIIAQLVLLLLHVSAENHSHLQGATNLYSVCSIQYIQSCCAHRSSNQRSPLYKKLERNPPSPDV